MLAPEIKAVTAFVDWNSQIHAAKSPKDADVTGVVIKTLDYVGRTICQTLVRCAPTARFDVTLRIYYGWHKGFEPTPTRKALKTISSSDDIFLSTNGHVTFRKTIFFGDELLSALQCRMHIKLACHLPNTLRTREEGDEEKMVDTALASDVVGLALREPQRWLLIMGEDDDLVPPVFTAEGNRGPKDGKVLLLRERPSGPFLKLDNLRVTPR